MLRRNAQYDALNQETQVLDFSYFKRKRQDPFFFSFAQHQPSTFNVSDMPNALSHILVISAILTRHPLKKKIPSSSTFSSQFTLKNVPKQFQNYLHPQTLENFLIVLRQYAQPNSLVHLLNNYPISWFLLNSISRAIIFNYLVEHEESWFFGNEKQLLQDYQLEIRGSMLQILAQFLDFQFCVKFHKYNQSEPCVVEEWGKKGRTHLTVIFKDNEWKWEIDSQNPEYIESNISYLEIFQYKPNGENLDSTDEGKSMQRAHSANKDLNLKCNFCGVRIKLCSCYQQTKIITPRPIAANNQFFDRKPAGKFTRKKGSNPKKCYSCRKERCICKK